MKTVMGASLNDVKKFFKAEGYSSLQSLSGLHAFYRTDKPFYRTAFVLSKDHQALKIDAIAVLPWYNDINHHFFRRIHGTVT
jgi:hypothetical protein